ncbi:MAG: class I SAM-dependent methyltransferase [Deferribacteraceae bacterium]|jgi:O-methyltransferase involved in polyketide biosynthesis|nr:class I SAM-dependent methyltransferase [Deferribacteraceae bacterium]
MRFKSAAAMDDKTLQSNTIQSTMLIPLYGRMIAGRRFPDILLDTAAERICESVEYDFSAISQTYGGEYTSLACLVRAARIDECARSFIAAHPNGTVINLGSGLDDTFSRVDNGSVHWYNLDLSAAVAYRENFIKPTDRSKNIAKSMFDYTWLNDVGIPSDGYVLVLAAGLFFFFEEAEISALFRKISGHSPHGEMYFDACSRSGMKIANKMVRRTGNSGAEMKFWTDNAEQVKSWSQKITEAVCLPYFGNLYKDRRISRFTRFLMWGADFLKRTKFVRVRW